MTSPVNQSDWRIRSAGDEDLEAVVGIHALHRQLPLPPVPSVDERATWQRMMNTPDLTVYIAEIASRPVGTATTMIMPNIVYDCAPTLFVEAVVVVPDFRRRGIATAIMQRVLSDARVAGCNKVQLLSHKRHAEDGAHSLYYRLGFNAEAEGFRLYLRTRS